MVIHTKYKKLKYYRINDFFSAQQCTNSNRTTFMRSTGYVIDSVLQDTKGRTRQTLVECADSCERQRVNCFFF